MSDSSILILLLLPVTEWFVSFVASLFLFKGGVRLPLQTNHESETDFKEVQVKLAYASLIAHFFVLLGTLVWRSKFATESIGFSAPTLPLHAVVLGAIAGWAWYAGLFSFVAIQRSLLPTSILNWEAPALYVDGIARRSLFLAGLVAIEFWRVAALSSLQADGLSPSSALIICAAVYAGRLLLQGRHRIAYGALEGLLYGGLFFHYGTLVAPLSGRIIFEIGLYGLLRKTFRRLPSSGFPVLAQCPVCHKGLTTSELGQPASALRCPHCHEVIGITYGRQRLRLACYAVSFFVFLTLLGEISPGQLHGDTSMYLGILESTAAALGFTIWVDSLVPPQLDPGNPDLPTLDLAKRQAPSAPPDQSGPDGEKRNL
jgi:hypothetical protein